MSEPVQPGTRAPASRRQLVAWAFYDWASTPFFAVVITFVFSAYFIQGVAGDEVLGTAYWGWMTTASALVIAACSPILGAIADVGGRRKPWLVAFTGLSAATTAGLWLVTPDAAAVPLALTLVLVANVATEVATSFYNAMLPDLAPAERVGRWSGWGWGLGYLGGIAALALVLLLFVQREPPLFGLDKAAAEHVRICGPLLAVWLVVFALPLFLITPDLPSRRRPAGTAVRDGLRQLGRTIRDARRELNLLRFLGARLVYNDGLNTLFAFGGIYAAGTFGMQLEEIILFGIALNLTAGLGAFGFAYLDDHLGSKPTILVALAGLIVVGLVALIATDKTVFWIAALFLGLFLGPAQSASRTLMARLAPADKRTEMFGLYALTGKVTAFLGPFLFGTATWLFASQRAGMATVLVMFVAGGLLLTTVREPGRRAATSSDGDELSRNRQGTGETLSKR